MKIIQSWHIEITFKSINHIINLLLENSFSKYIHYLGQGRSQEFSGEGGCKKQFNLHHRAAIKRGQYMVLFLRNNRFNVTPFLSMITKAWG